MRRGILDLYEIVGDIRPRSTNYRENVGKMISEAATDVGSHYMIATIHDDAKERIERYSMARGMAIEVRSLLGHQDAFRFFDDDELDRARVACERVISALGIIRDDEVRARKTAATPASG